MVAPDIRDAAELLEYYRRTVFEAGPIYPRQSPSAPSEPPTSPTPAAPTTPTTAPTSPTTSSTSSTSSTSTTDTTSTTSTTSTLSTTSTSTTARDSPNNTQPSRPSNNNPSSPGSSTSSTRGSVSSYVTTRTTTDANGQPVTTVQVVATLIPDPTPDNNSSSSVNTGAIVGGVVGGIAVIALLVGLFVWWRKKSRFDDFEANLFDPDHTIKRPMSTADPHNDLTTAAVPEAARNITPYSYGHQRPASTATAGTTAQGSSVGWQPEARPPSGYYAYDNASNAGAGGAHYRNPSTGTEGFPNPYNAPYGAGYNVPGTMAAGMGAGALGATALNRGPTVSSTTSSSYYPPVYPPSHAPPASSQFPQTYGQPMPAPMPAPTPSPPNPRGAKEREAFQRTHGNGKGGWGVANQGVDSSGSGGEGVGVRQHQDAGRVNIGAEDEEARRDAEIPPTYESIRDNLSDPTPAVQPPAGN